MERIFVPMQLAKLSPMLAALALSGWGASASAQDEAIPDSVATDVGASSTEAAGEATFTAPPPDLADTATEADGETPEADSKAEIDWNLSAGGSVEGTQPTICSRGGRSCHLLGSARPK